MPEDNTASPLVSGDSTPRIAFDEKGVTGLLLTNKSIYEEANRNFRFPQFLKVVDEMRNDAAVSACLLGNKTLMGRLPWHIAPPKSATEEQKEKAKYISQVLFEDMESGWRSFISEVLSYLEYGFSLHEIVYGRRLKSKGSKFNDGLIRLRKLAPRSQSTIIDGWVYDETGRNLLAVEQDLSNVQSIGKFRLINNSTGKVIIPRDKFLLFRADATKDNPEGRSLLKGVYVAYRQAQLIADQRMIGIARDLGGLPVARLHPRYMSPDASDSERAVYTAVQDMVKNVSSGAQSSIVFPSLFDSETKQNMFEFSLLESKGGARFDVSNIIAALEKNVMRGLGWDVYNLSGNLADNYSIRQGRTNLTALHLNYRANEIADVINEDLIPKLFAANGWTDEVFPTLVPGDFDEPSLEEMSKYLQRVTAVGLVEKDRDILNLVRRQLAVPEKPADEPVDWEAIDPGSSRSGDGLASKTGGLNGTGDSAPKEDNSANNLDNAG